MRVCARVRVCVCACACVRVRVCCVRAVTTCAQRTTFAATVQRGEYFTFQVGLYVPPRRAPLRLTTTFLDGAMGNGTCFNTAGVDSRGAAFTRVVDVLAGDVTALWLGVHIPSTLTNLTELRGSVSLTFSSAAEHTASHKHATAGVADRDGADMTVRIDVRLTVDMDAPTVRASGDADPSRLSRLRWLDSTLGADDDVVAPYTPIRIDHDTSWCSAEAAAAFTLHILQRAIAIGSSGLPVCVQVHRPPSTRGVRPARTTPLLSRHGVELRVVQSDGEPLPLAATTRAPVLTKVAAGEVRWWALLRGAGGLHANVSASLAFDGFFDASIQLFGAANTSGGQSLSSSDGGSRGIATRDVQLRVALASQTHTSPRGLRVMGMGVQGRTLREGGVSWRWSLQNRSNQLWVGTVDAGVRVHLKGDGAMWESPMPKYDRLPPSWHNGGRGGANVSYASDGSADVIAYGGARTLPSSSADAPLTFRFDLSFSPYRQPNESVHWSLRHFQNGYPTPALSSPQEVAATGATVVNIHQGVDSMINPYINYPFDPRSVALLANYTRAAHALGMRVKFYYTVRELSNHAAELWALRSLGDEVLQTSNCTATVRSATTEPSATHHSPAARSASSRATAAHFAAHFAAAHGEGARAPNAVYDRTSDAREANDATEASDASAESECGGTAWHRQHLGSDYVPAWISPLSNGEFDAAVMQNGVGGRWLNYYVEGLRHSLAADPHIDGIYYDGILFGRHTMMRVRKVLERFATGAQPPLIDFHTGNNWPGKHTVDAVAYGPHWAYVDSLWIGEGYSYDSSPDYWLIRMSGLPFGVFSDMLGSQVNAQRGMLFGSTGRFGCVNATPIWRFWDDWAIHEADMVGWWDAAAPVVALAASRPTDNILATSYVVPGNRTLIAIASWAPQPTNVTLAINWTAIGLLPRSVCELHAPPIDGLQSARSWPREAPIRIDPAGGWLLEVRVGADC